MSILKVQKTTGLRGRIRVPGDKSISHRSIILGSLAEGTTRVRGFLESEDCLNTLRIFQQLGVPITKQTDGTIEIEGVGLNGLKEPGDVLDAGNSGTGIRLISGVLAGQPFYSVISGDESIRKRPMGRIVEPLKEMGALIYGRDGGSKAPLTIVGGELWPIDYVSPVASAQIKSAVLLAGLFVDGETSVSEPVQSRNHTELMLKGFGAEIEAGQTTVRLKGRPTLRAQDIEVPGDISSAAYFIVAALITPDSEITVDNVGINPTRTGIIDALLAMGADIKIENIREHAGEKAADITARTSQLRATDIVGDMIPRLIDEVPILAIAAAAASGRTVIADAKELRVKESDRIATVIEEVSKFGVRIDELHDGMIIWGNPNLTGAPCESHGDHRIAMSCAIAGLIADDETIITNTDNIRTSFPNFEGLLEQVISNS